MNIGAALELFITEYEHAKLESFSGHPVANFIRQDIPQNLQNELNLGDRYLIKGSAGQSKWARVPWVAIYDRFITETVQDGYYIVYLVKEDFSGIYLTLNQGVTHIKNTYGSDSKKALKIRARDFLAKLGHFGDELILGDIDLATTDPNGLGGHYEVGNILAKYYDANDIPSEDLLLADLREFLGYYLNLSSKEVLQPNISEEDDEDEFEGEDLRNFREHKRLERNRKLSAKAKRIHGYNCQACGMNFLDAYGEIGRSYIEAHHLTPIKELKGQKVKLDPKKDFAVLCANCHSMIHRSEFVSDVRKFREIHLKNK